MAEATSVFQRGNGKKQFSMFLGVFTPSVLTILGVIMYLRFPWVVANVGLGGAIVIVLMCNAISFITALSASSIATNMAMGTGGEYFLISRSFGLTIGGAIGIPLFLCRTLSVTLYCYGLAELLTPVLPAGWNLSVQWVAAGFVLLATVTAGKSASVALRVQLILMALVALSLLALATGVLTGPLQSPALRPNEDFLTESGGFWVVLAVFFPAVTGFNVGMGMSGSIRDPQKSIPRGTLLAVGVGLVIYLVVPILLAITAKVTGAQLGNISPDTAPVWTRIALFGGLLIYPGIWSAILSSAFGSALAGPRVLQALASDGLAPKFLAATSKTGQPTVAAVVSGAIALAAVALGNLNAVALMVTILFLTLYLSINSAAAVEALVGDPSYRPTLRVPWLISVLGIAGTLAIMFLINPIAGGVAIGLELLVWLYLRKKHMQAAWGDVWTGVWRTLARLVLYKLSLRVRNPRSWRPNIMLFADHIEERVGLARIAAWFNLNRGILTVCDVISGSCDENTIAAGNERTEALTEFFKRHQIMAFANVNILQNFESEVLNVVQAAGVGRLRSNTVMFGWPSQREGLVSLLRIFRGIEQLGKAAAIVHPVPAAGPDHFNNIDVWWRGKQNNGDLMLLLAHLLRLNPMWRQARITVRSIVNSETSKADRKESLTRLISETRIQADHDVIVKPDEKTVIEIMQEISRTADVVFLGLQCPEPGQEAQYARHLQGIIAELPTTVLIRNSGPLRGRLLD